jgi:hypothetical protein
MYKVIMWIELDSEELDVITEALKHCNLHGMNFLLKSQLNSLSPRNIKHSKKNAVKAAQIYFSADDLMVEDDYVKWTEEGDALVMCWQKVPKEFIVEEDCGCGK